MNGARADVRTNVLRRGIDIFVSPLPGRALTWNVASEEVDAAAHASGDQILTLPDDVARALYEGLNRYYGGSDAGTLRADLEHERGRVDLLIKAILPTRPATAIESVSDYKR